MWNQNSKYDVKSTQFWQISTTGHFCQAPGMSPGSDLVVGIIKSSPSTGLTSPSKTFAVNPSL